MHQLTCGPWTVIQLKWRAKATGPGQMAPRLKVFFLLPRPRPAAGAPEAAGRSRPRLTLASVSRGFRCESLGGTQSRGCPRRTDTFAVGGRSSEASLKRWVAGSCPPWGAQSPVGTPTTMVRGQWRQPSRSGESCCRQQRPHQDLSRGWMTAANCDGVDPALAPR